MNGQDVILKTQADVDGFDQDVTQINGDLVLGYFLEGSDIVDLSSLSDVIAVTESLVIFYNDSLTNISELNLSSVNGIKITNNERLLNLDRILNITETNKITISDNPRLVNVDGLSNIMSVDEDLYITVNDVLDNLDGLQSLTHVGGVLSFYQNPELTNLDGVVALESIGESLFCFVNHL